MKHDPEQIIATSRHTDYRCRVCCRPFRVMAGTTPVWPEDCGEEAAPLAEPPRQSATEATDTRVPPAGVATQAEQKRRLTICAACPELTTCLPTTCAKRKAVETGICPKGKWEPPYIHTPPTSEGRIALPAITTRHLIYHVYPFAGNEVWRDNLRQLARRCGVFNGRRIIAVATGTEAHSPATVRACMRSMVGDDALGIEWMEVVDSNELREVASFPGLLRAVQTTDTNAAVFFAHSKGVSPWGTPPPGGIAWWRNAMYHYLLDEPGKIAALLRYWPTVGCCKTIWRRPDENPPPVRHGLVDRGQGPSPYPTGLFYGEWMFSGTFWWVRCDSLFGNWRWPFVPNDHYGAEAYLSGIFPAADAYTVYQPWPETEYPQASAYHPKWHQDRIDD